MKPNGEQKHRDAIREQVERIVTSDQFSRSERSSRLLKFLVEQSFEGSTHALKEYVVGVEVFDRSVDFDTGVSSIVRVEATRLRQKLRKYYETVGAYDPVIISLPRGGYYAKTEFRRNSKPRHTVGSEELKSPKTAIKLSIRPPKNPDAPAQDIRRLLDAISRTFLLAGGIDVLQVPRVDKRKASRRFRTKENATLHLELSVQPDALGMKVASAILRTRSGEIIWRTSLSGDADLTTCGCRIAKEVVACIQPPPSANRWYELGRHVLYQLTPTSLCNSRVCFEQAVLTADTNPRAYAALAIACALLYIFDAGEPGALIERIRASAPRGIGAEYGAEVYLALAIVAWGHERNWKETERLLNIARDIDPRARIVRYGRALCLASSGRNMEAAEELLRSHNLNSFSVDAELATGCACWLQGDYGAAATRIRCAIAAEPTNAVAHLLLGWTLLADSRPQEAIQSLEMARTLSGPGSPAISALGCALARTGKMAPARDILEHLGHEVEARYQVDADAGMVRLALGDEQQALVCLRTAREKESGRLSILHFTPELDVIRSLWLPALLTKSLTSVA